MFKVNVLVCKDGRACLADFNLISDEQTDSSAKARWMSPELFYPGQFNLEDVRPTEASDCYALGMVMYEILSGKTPFYQHPPFLVVGKILQGERPVRPQEPQGGWITDSLWGILELCWKHQPTHRISAKTVLLCLEGELPPSQLPPCPNGDVTTDVGDQSDDTSEEEEYVSPVPFPAHVGLFSTAPLVMPGDEGHPNPR
jgi:serine/threonine protein kinase